MKDDITTYHHFNELISNISLTKCNYNSILFYFLKKTSNCNLKVNPIFLNIEEKIDNDTSKRPGATCVTTYRDRIKALKTLEPLLCKQINLF